MSHVCHTCNMRGISTQFTHVDIPHNLHAWIFHVIYKCGFCIQFTCMDKRVFMALLFNACITSANNSLNVSNFTKCWYKYHMFTILTITSSNALLVAHIIKNKFNSTYCCRFKTSINPATLPTHAEIQEVVSLACCLYVCVSFLEAEQNISPRYLAVYHPCGEACNATTHKEFCSCEDNLQ